MEKYLNTNLPELSLQKLSRYINQIKLHLRSPLDPTASPVRIIKWSGPYTELTRQIEKKLLSLLLHYKQIQLDIRKAQKPNQKLTFRVFIPHPILPGNYIHPTKFPNKKAALKFREEYMARWKSLHEQQN